MPLLRSWVDSANDPEGHFPLNNLPFGAFQHRENDEHEGVSVAIGDKVLDLTGMEEAGLLNSTAEEGGVFFFPLLNEFMECGPELWAAMRAWQRGC